MQLMRPRLSACALLATLATVLPSATAGAASVTSCGTYGAATIDVAADLVQGTLNANCLVLTNTGGVTDVHLNGFTITCSNGSGCGAAITRGAGASLYFVDSTAGTTTAGIFGEWTYGIRNGYASGIRIDGPDYGIYNEAATCGSSCLVQSNVIRNCDVGIWASATGSITDNYVVDSTTYGIDVSSAGSAVAVDHNYVRGYGSAGIRVASTVSAAGNIVERGNGSYPPTISPVSQVGGTPPAAGWSASTNICEDTTWCPRKTPPFFLP